VKWPSAAPEPGPRDDIWPTDRAPVIRRLEDGTNAFSELRWGFPPARSKGAPVINFRSEGRRFSVDRCLVPASHFFEFTGTKSPKTKWKFTKTGEDWFCFAGLWRPMAAGGEAFTLLTPDPSPDVAPIPFADAVFTVATDPTVLPLSATFETFNYHLRSILRSTRVSEGHDRHFQMRPLP
jgi:putative SOS response-associated peptidase YedK